MDTHNLMRVSRGDAHSQSTVVDETLLKRRGAGTNETKRTTSSQAKLTSPPPATASHAEGEKGRASGASSLQKGETRVGKHTHRDRLAPVFPSGITAWRCGWVKGWARAQKNRKSVRGTVNKSQPMSVFGSNYKDAVRVAAMVAHSFFVWGGLDFRPFLAFAAVFCSDDEKEQQVPTLQPCKNVQCFPVSWSLSSLIYDTSQYLADMKREHESQRARAYHRSTHRIT